METQNLVQSSQGQTWATALGCVSGGEKKYKNNKKYSSNKIGIIFVPCYS